VPAARTPGPGLTAGCQARGGTADPRRGNAAVHRPTFVASAFTFAVAPPRARRGRATWVPLLCAAGRSDVRGTSEVHPRRLRSLFRLPRRPDPGRTGRRAAAAAGAGGGPRSSPAARGSRLASGRNRL